MNDALNNPQTALLLGGTSEIGIAIIERLTAEPTAGNRLRTVVLASRDATGSAAVAERLRARHHGLTVHTLPFEARDVGTHPALVDQAIALAGDLDLVIVAAGFLGVPDDGTGPLADHSVSTKVAEATFLGPMSIVHAAASRLHAQGHGVVVVISSAGALRARKTNPAYGASKAGIDGFTLAMAERLRGSGVRLMLVRPGFVHTKMTAGLTTRKPPMSTTPERVAIDVVTGLLRGQAVVWSPRAAALPARLVALAPAFLARRIPF